VREVVDGVCACWEAAAASRDERPVVDFHQDALSLTINVLGRFAFGCDFDSDVADGSDRSLNGAFECVLHRMSRFGRNPLLFATRRVATAQNQQYWRALGTIDRAARKAIERRLGQDELGDDLLGQLLKAAESEDDQMDTDLIVENLRTFLFAGHDTTASTLAWAVHLLSTHPYEEKRLLQELGTLPRDVLPDAEALESLPYLDAVFKETLRLYPPAGFTREPLEDITIGDFRVSKGTEVFFFPYLTHRDPRLFAEPERFRPERWLEASPTGRASAAESSGWMPFSLGARNCVGAQLARLEIKATLHAFLSRYSFEPAPDDGTGPPAVVLYMTLVPNAVRVIPRPRSDCKAS